MIARADELSLAQLALKGLMPGIPDFYQGAEGPLHHLTDPDNRLAVDWDRLGCPESSPGPGGFARRKDALTRRLLALRAEHPDLFAAGSLAVEGADGSWRLLREGPEGRLSLTLAWGLGEPVALEWSPAGAAQAAE
ncbi:putative hydrolase [Rubellimicrobium mesophilum DSM 19309]|uniref:Putative hydrolase n=1 Tax=Rubellimicrobium mesophilum DSM 19309 TaxID=442562 RepID=A0A017HLL4_9RHOB|nr:DUF3459 domain-containing protein [Rubellimicrobium mesophilum]EYD75215.1 putative hydrolase [Rubellimicrobium mesophilum DSM 19309]